MQWYKRCGGFEYHLVTMLNVGDTLGNKNENFGFRFVFHSFIRNFGFAEVTCTRK